VVEEDHVKVVILEVYMNISTDMAYPMRLARIMKLKMANANHLESVKIAVPTVDVWQWILIPPIGSVIMVVCLELLE
jgi:hypothetical protein